MFRTVRFINKNALEKFDAELDELFADKFRAIKTRNWRGVAQVRERINKKVVWWNECVLKGDKEVDLHRMTARGAIQFVQSKMEAMDFSGTLKIIIGRGKHSIGGVPKIKRLLQAYFKTRPRFRLEEEKGNPGCFFLYM